MTVSIVRARALALSVSALVLFQAAYQPPAAAAAEVRPPSLSLPADAGHANQAPGITKRPAAPITDILPGGGFAANAGVTARVEPAAGHLPTRPTVDAGRSTEYSTAVANPDGTVITTITAGRQNYQAPDGSWQLIDMTLVPDSTNGFAVRTRANDVMVRLTGSAGATSQAQVVGKGVNVHLRVPGAPAGTVTPANDAVRFDAGTGTVLALQPTPRGARVRDDDRVRDCTRLLRRGPGHGRPHGDPCPGPGDHPARGCQRHDPSRGDGSIRVGCRRHRRGPGRDHHDHHLPRRHLEAGARGVEPGSVLPDGLPAQAAVGGAASPTPSATPVPSTSSAPAASAVPTSTGLGPNEIRVIKPLPVRAGTVAPAWSQLGLGVQYVTPVRLGVLLRRNIIEAL